ncbi:MAG: hypothetical protein GY835_19060 [bacterium]|nr:hypothetical protein [bacterium]
MAANTLSGADRIELEAGIYTLTISSGVEHYYVEESGDLDILDDLEMVGAGSGSVIMGQNGDRIIDVEGNTSTFTGIELTGGRVSIYRFGGCARLVLSEVTLINVSIKNCFCEDGGGGLALELASATLINTTVSENESGWVGGGIVQLGIEPEHSLTIINSTISGNSARVVGGGIARLADGEALIIHSTIAQNEANYGDAIFLDTIRRTPIMNSIIEGTCTGFYPDSLGGNLVGPDIEYNCIFSHMPYDIAVEDLGLGPLADNGGPTMTHALLRGSAAINAADPASCEATDQRGVPRPVGTGCDIGAYEALISAVDIPVLGYAGLLALGGLLLVAGMAAMRR